MPRTGRLIFQLDSFSDTVQSYDLLPKETDIFAHYVYLNDETVTSGSIFLQVAEKTRTGVDLMYTLDAFLTSEEGGKAKSMQIGAVSAVVLGFSRIRWVPQLVA